VVKFDKLAAVADKTVIVGSSDDGATLEDAAVALAALQQRITWL
jgi:hypothetical protein